MSPQPPNGTERLLTANVHVLGLVLVSEDRAVRRQAIEIGRLLRDDVPRVPEEVHEMAKIVGATEADTDNRQQGLEQLLHRLLAVEPEHLLRDASRGEHLFEEQLIL